MLAEERSRQLHSGHESEPDVEAGHQAGVQVLRAKPVQDQREGEGGQQAGNEGAGVGRPSAFLHFVCASLIVGIVAHLAHPGFREEQRRVP